MSDGAAFVTGQQVGAFTVERELGSRGAAREYAATAADGTRVCVRILDPKVASNVEVRARFEREARVARAVEHPNLVAVLATGEHDSIPYMIQAGYDETTLADRIAAERRLPLDDVVSICGQVAAGLDALHAGGVVHRDVCSANVVLAGEVALLGGLGLVKDSGGADLTQAGAALGSIDYIAPEQIRGESVSPATDVYALGCVTFEALTGRTPFSDKAGMRALWGHMQEPPPLLTDLRPEVGADVCDAVGRALAKDPAGRPRTASQFARILALAAELAHS